MKHTPWTLELIDKWPFGVRVIAGDKEILHQSAICQSSIQKTRADCESGEGFPWRAEENWTTREQAAAAIAEQDNIFKLIVRAVNCHAEMVEALKVAQERGCMCHDLKDSEWHSPKCSIPQIRAALAKAEAQ